MQTQYSPEVEVPTSHGGSLSQRQVLTGHKGKDCEERLTEALWCSSHTPARSCTSASSGEVSEVAVGEKCGTSNQHKQKSTRL